MSLAINVDSNVARNPVARAIERARIARFGRDTEIEIRSLPDWAHCPSMLCGVAEAVAIAIKSIEGWDDPDAVGDVLVSGIDLIREMSEAGFVWRAHHVEPICAALQVALQILSGQDPREKLKAWAWAQGVEARERARAMQGAAA